MGFLFKLAELNQLYQIKNRKKPKGTHETNRIIELSGEEDFFESTKNSRPEREIKTPTNPKIGFPLNFLNFGFINHII